MERHARFDIQDTSQIGSARRQAVRMAESIDLRATEVGTIAIVVTELATNLLRYAQDGRLLFRCSKQDGFEAISIDRGPGLDVNRCLQDGYSTGGSPGTGLGAVRRAAANFDIYSLPEQGTIVWARLAEPKLEASFEQRWQCAGISLPVPGEEECGDAWATQVDTQGFRVVVTDGLGHGHDAAVVSNQVIHEFRNSTSPWSAKAFLERTHVVLSGSRGAAVAAGCISHDGNQFTFAGIGNISASILSSQSSKGLMSHNGTLGSRIRSVQAIEYEWPREGTLVLHTDGLTSRWSESAYPGVLTRHPAILAALLIRDFTRGRDDVTAVVIRRR